MPASLSALSHLALRTEIIATCREMNASGVNQGTSGNVSVRIGEGRFLVTPTGIPYAGMTEDQIVEMTFDGTYYGPCRPTSEWRFHRDILLNRPDIDTVIHTHSMFSTVISCLRRDIPAVHYMVAAAGGENVPLRRICHLRLAGPFRPCTESTGRPSRLPARQPWADRARRQPQKGLRAAGRGGDHCRPVLAGARRRHAGHPRQRRDAERFRHVQGLRPAGRGRFRPSLWWSGSTGCLTSLTASDRRRMYLDAGTAEPGEFVRRHQHSCRRQSIGKSRLRRDKR